MSSTLGPADYYAPGAYNAICDRCGHKFKSFQLIRDWQGLMVCAKDWEPRHPQDFVRAPQPEKPVQWTRPEQETVYAVFCTPNDITAIPGVAIPGCLIPGYIHPANTQGF